MKQYKYQMHAHTHPCSACSRLSPEELVESLRAGGYAGCVITNHFFHGNTGIDRRLAWEDFVAYYERDYLECKELAKKYRVMSIPTLLVFRNGELTSRSTGYISKDEVLAMLDA